MARPPYVVRDPDDPRFPHGSDKAYARGCHCSRCRAGHAAAVARHALLRERGHAVLVDSEPARAHVQAVVDATRCTGVQVSVATGVDVQAVRALLHGKKRRIRPAVAAALLGLTAEAIAPPPPVLVPRDRAVFLCRTLQAQGWGLRWQAQQLGHHSASAPLFMWGSRTGRLSKATVAAVEALHRQYRDVEGPDDEARRAARRLGFFPYAEYDDDELDEHGIPPLGRLPEEEEPPKRDSHATARWATLAMTLAGASAPAIARAEGITARTVGRYRVELGIEWAASGTEVYPRSGQRRELSVARHALARYQANGTESRAQWEELRAALAAVRAGRAQQRDANTAAA